MLSAPHHISSSSVNLLECVAALSVLSAALLNTYATISTHPQHSQLWPLHQIEESSCFQVSSFQVSRGPRAVDPLTPPRGGRARWEGEAAAAVVIDLLVQELPELEQCIAECALAQRQRDCAEELQVVSSASCPPRPSTPLHPR